MSKQLFIVSFVVILIGLSFLYFLEIRKQKQDDDVFIREYPKQIILPKGHEKDNPIEPYEKVFEEGLKKLAS